MNQPQDVKKEKKEGSKWATVGLDINWPELEEIFNEHNLAPHTAAGAWRDSIPVYHRDDVTRQIGYATSGTWSPAVKKNIAMATIEAAYAKPGTKVNFEVTVEHQRRTVSAIVEKPQFFNPERKRSNPKNRRRWQKNTTQ